MRVSKMMLMAMAGTAAGLPGIAAAQQTPAAASGNVVNLSGATLLLNFVTKRAAYNDYIDANGDGTAGSLGSLVQQDLAPAGSTSGYWVFTYRSVGSINGFRELLYWGNDADALTADYMDTSAVLGEANESGIAPYPALPPTTLSYPIGLGAYVPDGTQPSGWRAEVSGTAGTPDNAWTNRTQFITGGVPTGAFQQGNPGMNPHRADASSLLVLPGAGVLGGQQIDIAILDVPGRWAAQSSGTSGVFLKPGQVGYGTNTLTATNASGVPITTSDGTNQLPALPSGFNFFDPGNPGAANGRTLFDTALFWAPIAPMTNFGVGLTQIKVSDLQHGFATGRTRSGENLMFVTRDVGSGTRNGWQNTMGIAPDYGRGENSNARVSSSTNDLLGPNFRAANKSSNGRVENTVLNHRLAIGYVGAELGVSSGWLLGGANARAEFLAVQNDFTLNDPTATDYTGATEYSRPSVSEVLHNDKNGYVLGGPAALVTRGDPAAEPFAQGGDGLSHPKMRSQAAARWVNNVRRSIENFTAVPLDPENVGMPGELAATQFILSAALDNLHSLTNPVDLQTNTSLNAALQANTITSNVLANAAYASFNAAGIGRSARTDLTSTSGKYSDGVLNGTAYLKQNGTTIGYSTTLPLRNKVSGDFSGDGLRNINDIPDMILAWKQRNGGAAWSAPNGSGAIAGAPGTDAIIEVLGDFDGNGSFGNTGGNTPAPNYTDVRYFADGLATDASTGALDRRAGFIKVDASFGCNFFGTILGTSAPGIATYQSGASAADIAGAVGTTPGFVPVGADGKVDDKDIDYIFAQFKRNSRVTDGAANWTNLNEAAHFDLSADVTGDLVVDQLDADMVVLQFLNTNYGDVNLDGVVDASDTSTITSNLGTLPATWARGNVNGDAVIDAADLTLANANLGAARPRCIADVDDGSGTGTPDGGVTIDDLIYYLSSFEAGVTCADVDDGSTTGTIDGGVTIDDLIYYLTRFEAGC
jgi:hypothetical protein